MAGVIICCVFLVCAADSDDTYCGWTKSISHHLETMGNHCLLVFRGESSFRGFLGGAGLRPSTVPCSGDATEYMVFLPKRRRSRCLATPSPDIEKVNHASMATASSSVGCETVQWISTLVPRIHPLPFCLAPVVFFSSLAASQGHEQWNDRPAEEPSMSELVSFFPETQNRFIAQSSGSLPIETPVAIWLLGPQTVHS